MKYLKTITLLLLISSFTAGCTSADNENSTEKTNTGDKELNIYTTIYPIQYAIEQIGGESISVTSVYPPGVDAHSYEPTTKDMTAIADSDAFIYLGADMEAFAETAADALKNQDVSLIEIGEHEELFHIESEDKHDDDLNHEHHESEDEHDHGHDGHHHGDHDPHIWIDPVRMLEMVTIIKDELIQLNPDSKALYDENFATLENELLALDEEFTNSLQDKTNKKILVSHAAYGYWEERYGIEQIAINGLSSNSEPSQKELTEIIDQAQESGLDYIVFEQNTSNRLSEVIQSEIGAETVTVHNLSVLTDENMENNEDYLSLMYKNLETLNLVTD